MERRQRRPSSGRAERDPVMGILAYQERQELAPAPQLATLPGVKRKRQRRLLYEAQLIDPQIEIFAAFEGAQRHVRHVLEGRRHLLRPVGLHELRQR